MRVAIDVTPAARQGAGVGRYTRELVRELVARGRNDYVPFLADRMPTGSTGRMGIAPGGPSVRSTGIGARWMNILWHRLGVPISAERWTGPIDAFHACDFLAPPLTRACAVVTVHDLSFLRLPQFADPGLRRYLARAVPRSVHRADHVLADSEHTRSDVIALLGADGADITVAYPGVGATFRKVRDSAVLGRARERYGLNRPFVLGVGTIEPRKDWATLVEAFERSGLADHALVLAGSLGWLADATVAAVGRSPADVRRIGFVDESDLPALYNLADAFAYPSRYEGFGLPPLESMACGTPTVVSDASCLPEVVGDAALIVPTGDASALSGAIRQLVTDGAVRDALAVAGPRRAAAFTWARCAAAAEAAYSQAVSLREAGA